MRRKELQTRKKGKSNRAVTIFYRHRPLFKRVSLCVSCTSLLTEEEHTKEVVVVLQRSGSEGGSDSLFRREQTKTGLNVVYE